MLDEVLARFAPGGAIAALFSDYVAIDARLMLIAAVALLIYGAARAASIRRVWCPIWIAAAAPWLAWLAAAFAVWNVGNSLGLLR